MFQYSAVTFLEVPDPVAKLVISVVHNRFRFFDFGNRFGDPLLVSSGLTEQAVFTADRRIAARIGAEFRQHHDDDESGNRHLNNGIVIRGYY